MAVRSWPSRLNVFRATSIASHHRRAILGLFSFRIASSWITSYGQDHIFMSWPTHVSPQERILGLFRSSNVNASQEGGEPRCETMSMCGKKDELSQQLIEPSSDINTTKSTCLFDAGNLLITQTQKQHSSYLLPTSEGTDPHLYHFPYHLPRHFLKSAAMKISAILALVSFAIVTNAVAIDGHDAAMAKLFQRDIAPRDDPCMTPCMDKTSHYCPHPGGCGLQWYVMPTILQLLLKRLFVLVYKMRLRLITRGTIQLDLLRD